MMMAQKHLHELLSQDQEPFQLQNYIADRRCQLKTRPPTHKFTTSSTLQSKKLRKPNLQTSSSRRTLCKQACFFSFHDSPDIKKSPFPSPAKSPCKIPNSANTVFLHIPAKTAAVLLEAAMKIQKQSPNSKSKTHAKNAGFGLFGSILRKLKDKNKTKRPQISLNGAGVIVKDDPFVENRKFTRKMEKENILGLCVVDKSGNYEMGFPHSCNNSRLSSAGWSESNEDKSCSTSRSDYTEEIDFPYCEKHCCSSPLSPFRFALHRSPSVGHRTPNFLSPAASPIHHKKEEINNQEADNLQKMQLEEDEEKDQCSPVSVLDPLFQDYDDEERDGGEEEEDDDNSYDLECSYAIVQRAKLQLLRKLHRFERLAELEPTELEKRMLEEYDDDELIEEEECDDVDESRSLYNTEENVDGLIREVFSRSNLFHLKKIPGEMKRLVLDLITEEKMKGLDNSNEVVVNMVCKRLDSWKEVESNTIDMMVELDLRREGDGWTRYLEDVAASAEEIERAVFGLLVEELAS